MFENLLATYLHRFNSTIFCHKDSFSEIYWIFNFNCENWQFTI